MTEEIWSAVDEYIVSKLHDPDASLDEAIRASDAAGLPSIQVSAAQGKFLHILVKAHGAKRILEIGTLGGYSTIWMARALPNDGRLITMEIEPAHAAVAKANVERAGVADRVEVLVGNALDLLPDLEKREQQLASQTAIHNSETSSLPLQTQAGPFEPRWHLGASG